MAYCVTECLIILIPWKIVSWCCRRVSWSLEGSLADAVDVLVRSPKGSWADVVDVLVWSLTGSWANVVDVLLVWSLEGSLADVVDVLVWSLEGSWADFVDVLVVWSPEVSLAWWCRHFFLIPCTIVRWWCRGLVKVLGWTKWWNYSHWFYYQKEKWRSKQNKTKRSKWNDLLEEKNSPSLRVVE